MSEFINTIDLLGDEAVSKAFVERTIAEFNDNELTSVGSYAFYRCYSLTRVNMPNVTSIGINSFRECTNLASIHFPNANTIVSTSFYGCSALTSANFPLVTSTGSEIFRNCSALKSVDLPFVQNIRGDTFRSCTSLQHIDLPSATSLENNCFHSCVALKTVILRSGTVCTITSQLIFSGTPFYSGKSGGTLLVPRSLVEEYKNATNWSVIWGYGHNRFLALEDYTIDGTITGEIDWDKLNGGN